MFHSCFPRPLLQIMQNFRISPPRRKGVFPRCCSTHSLTSVDVQFHVFSWFYSIQLTLAQFNDFTKRRTGIKFSICFNCSMCTARQTLEFFPLILFFLFFLASTQLHTTLFLVRALSKRHRTVKLEQISTTIHLFIFLCFTSEPPEKSIFCAVLVTTRNSRCTKANYARGPSWKVGFL